MKCWKERPREIRNLFNPAFCGVILLRGVAGYQKEVNRPMPFSLTLLIPALALHLDTREVLKRGMRSYFVKTIEENPRILVGLPERIRGLFPYTMEAFAFLDAQGAISVSKEGAIAIQDGAIRPTIIGSEETQDIQKVAGALGRKFAQIGDRTTIYTTLGIRP